MGHSYIEFGQHHVYWKDFKVMAVFSYVHHVAKDTKAMKTLERFDFTFLEWAINGVCQVELTAAVEDRGVHADLMMLLDAALRGLELEPDGKVAADKMNAAPLKKPDTYFGDVDVEYISNGIEDLKKLLNQAPETKTA